MKFTSLATASPDRKTNVGKFKILAQVRKDETRCQSSVDRARRR